MKTLKLAKTRTNKSSRLVWFSIQAACHLVLTSKDSAYPWISMGIHRYPWVSMDTHGYPLISIDIHGYPWPMEIHRIKNNEHKQWKLGNLEIDKNARETIVENGLVLILSTWVACHLVTKKFP